MEIILVLIVILGLIILFKVGGVLLRILLNMILGFILLFIVDLIPSVDIPLTFLQYWLQVLEGFLELYSC
jgi:inhibitor of the pro-sigma K processing machinery